MQDNQILDLLKSKRLNKAQIDEVVDQLLISQRSLDPVLDLVALEDMQKSSFNAAWMLDNLLRKELKLLLPSFDKFLEILPALKWESCTRPMAHITEMVCLARFKRKEDAWVKKISGNQLELLATVCFDWLIDEKRMVATKVFAMTSLAYLGKQIEWVPEQLRPILIEQMPKHTVAYKARAQKTLKLLSTYHFKKHL